MSSNVFRCLTAAVLLAALPATAGEPDATVRQLLDGRGVKYEVDADGDFKIVYELDEGRTQLAFVRSNVEEYGAVRIREILSIGYRAEGAEFPAQVANRLLDHSNDVKLGGWTTQDDVALFTVKIPADASAQELVDALEFAVHAADAIEREFSADKDEF